MPGMQPDAGAHSYARRPGLGAEGLLDAHGGGHGLPGASKGDAEAIALRPQFLATRGCEGAADKLAVGCVQVAVAGTELLKQVGRAFEVGEEQGDGPAREG